jgi:hypothetical protein
MKKRHVGALVIGLALSASSNSGAQSPAAPSWTLPRGVAVKDAGPRTYRFTVDYKSASPQGAIVHRQRITGDYTRGLAGGEVQWKDVAQAEADGASGPFGSAQKRDFMEGFRYKNDLGGTMQPEFFKVFPPTAFFERAKPTRSQLIGRAMNDRAVGHGKVSAADVARFVFDAVEADRFYIYSHPKALGSVQTRLEDVVQARNPTDPFAAKPEIGAELRAALRAPG